MTWRKINRETHVSLPVFVVAISRLALRCQSDDGHRLYVGLAFRRIHKTLHLFNDCPVVIAMPTSATHLRGDTLKDEVLAASVPVSRYKAVFQTFITVAKLAWQRFSHHHSLALRLH